MSQYINDSQCRPDQVCIVETEQAVARARTFLSTDFGTRSELERLAGELDQFLRGNDLGAVEQNIETCDFEQDGSGIAFDEAKRQILIEEIGEDGLENAIVAAETVLEAYAAMLHRLKQPDREFYATPFSDWRVYHVVRLAKERTKIRGEADKGRD